MSARPIR